jgi:predicted transcriptional regulator
MTMANPTVALRLDEQVQKRLKSLGQRKDRSPHYLMKEAVESYLATEEALVAEQDLTQARWEQFELTGETLSHDHVKNWASDLQSSSKASSQS